MKLHRPVPHHIKVKTVVTAGLSLVTVLSLGVAAGYLSEAFAHSVNVAGLLVNLIWVWEL